MAVAQQLSLLGGPVSIAEAAVDPGADYGEVFTRQWVVEFILDLVGYTADRDLGGLVLVEPSCGTGAFLGPIVDRLIASARDHGRPLASLGPSIRAFDLLDANAELARKTASLKLQDAGLDQGEADTLAAEWVTTGDFLLQPHATGCADVVVGNPPYIRLESVPEERMSAYRSACPTMRGRADIYVGFYEMGLSLLKPGGVLGFICADRWMRNQYGADLRALVTANHAVETVVSMHDVDAFEDDVSAYPAVVVLRNGAQQAASVIETNKAFGENESRQAARWVRGGRRATVEHKTYEATRVDGWFKGRDLWPTGSPAQLALIADLEARFPPLQDTATGTRVGIGVATGCDEVFITADPDLVEEDRLLPLLQSSDTTAGTVAWAGSYLVNPWSGAGLVDLDAHPRLAEYLDAHRGRLRARHIARKRPASWYRTIDRVDHDLTGRAKLVLPDMKATAHPVLDDGGYYPHHNLYFVVSDAWDLEVLGGLLLSDVANLFVGAYCVRMRGGCYRFQAQYLRRIRVPAIGSVSGRDQRALASAFRSRDGEAATAAAMRAYGIDDLPGVG
jgi:adenine-specific DNA-methyltransferase